MNKLCFGIIGCGWFGNVHLDNLLKMPDVEVKALATGNKERLHAAGQKVPNARLYADYHEMFRHEQLDAVVICVTPERHEDIEEVCCGEGIPFYVEKPLGISRDAVIKTAELVRKTGLLTAAGYQERYNPALKEVRGYLEQRPAGIVTGSWIDAMPSPEWWRTKSRSGGQIVEQTTHLFDIFRYLFGEVKTVYAVGKHSSHFPGMAHDTEDYSTTVMTFENDLVATLHSGSYSKNDSAKMVGFRISMADCFITYEWNKMLQIRSENHTLTKMIQADNHFTALRAFVDAVKYGTKELIRSPYEDSAKSCLLTLAANESLETGKIITL